MSTLSFLWWLARGPSRWLSSDAKIASPAAPLRICSFSSEFLTQLWNRGQKLVRPRKGEKGLRESRSQCWLVTSRGQVLVVHCQLAGLSEPGSWSSAASRERQIPKTLSL